MIDATSEARSSGISREASRRRTFAIISHPDAGKTTLTEKLLLYGGAVQLAGSVTARKHQRATTSDWMELEKQRGISVSSTVLQFEYKDYVVNLLDTVYLIRDGSGIGVFAPQYGPRRGFFLGLSKKI